MSTEQRRTVLTLRVTAAEHEAMRRAAAAAGMSVSTYVRSRIAGDRSPEPSSEGVRTTGATSSPVIDMNQSGISLATGAAWAITAPGLQMHGGNLQNITLIGRKSG